MQLGNPRPVRMTYPLLPTLLLSFAAHTNGLPTDHCNGTPDTTIIIRGEATDDHKGLSNEAIIGIAAIFASILLFILGLALAAPRIRIFGQRSTTKTRQKLHRRWHRSRY
jgi:hypothetical protein